MWHLRLNCIKILIYAVVQLILTLTEAKTRMDIKWENGCLKSIQVNGIKGINWGIETADRKSFFTLDGHYRGCTILNMEEILTSGGYRQRLETEMAEGHWIAERDQRIKPNQIHIDQTLEVVKDSVLVDFVVRFKFVKNSFTKAVINGRVITHSNRNIWHQHPVKEALLTGAYGTVSICVSSCETSGKFYQVLYVRDEPGSWIIHARLLPSEPCDIYWIRWANRFFTFSLNDKWSRMIL